MFYKIGVIGDKNSVMPFKLTGYDVHYASSREEALRALTRMLREEYGVIYICEDLFQMLTLEIDAQRVKLTPAIISIPTHNGTNDLGKKRIANDVEKAVGQNIL